MNKNKKLICLPWSLWGIEIISYLSIFISNFSSKPDSKFMAMFMGVIDGDGYIEIGPQKQYNKISKLPVKSTIRARLVIRLHSRDKDLLNYLVKVLGTGSLSNLDSINQIRLIFSKKDLISIIIPLIKKYNLEFLTNNRINQYALLTYILENNIVHWDDVQFKASNLPKRTCEYFLNLKFFADWLVGFTMAEGSFGMKASGSAFYQIRQKGLENYNILKAICLIITNKQINDTKPDANDNYQVSLTSKIDVQKTINFFSSSNNHPLIGYKLEQYKLWLVALKASSRYSHLVFPAFFVKGASMSLSSMCLLMFTMSLNEELIIEIIINNLFLNGLNILHLDFFNYLNLNFSSLFSLTSMLIIPFNTKNQTPKTEGPLSPYIVSVIFGSLLGNANVEQNKDGNKARIKFFQERIVVKYLLWVHNSLATAGYCNPNAPKFTRKLGVNGKVLKVIKFSSWTLTSFNWIYDLWYAKNKKIIPQSIKEYLTPLAIAVWIMNSGYKSHGGLKLLTYSFSCLDCMLLSQALDSKFNLKTTIKRSNKPDKWFIYVNKESMPYLNSILFQYFIPSMRYKILP
uniref:Homing endonuclease LAGLIDADG domain-containing protein n=1 Tax=Dactylella sp. TaxID=1814903 RepID=A0A482DRG1_9PEZI|nr:hypothetical protein [Dactylella sp.]